MSSPSQDFGTRTPVRVTVSVGSAVPRTAAFLVDGTVVNRQLSTSGKAVFTLSSRLAPGKHAITATYVPTSAFYLAPRITAATLTARSGSATTLWATGSTQPFRPRKSVGLVATVKLSKTAPAGKVSFKVDGKQWALVALRAGKAGSSVPVATAIGRHHITATFVPTTPAFQMGSGSAVRIVTVTAH